MSNGIKNEELLDEYVKTSYLLEIEEVLANNIYVYRTKSNDFAHTFLVLIPCLLLYLGLASFIIIQKKEEVNRIVIENYQDIINFNKAKMNDENKEKQKVDPKMVIKTQPVTIKESVILNKDTKKSESKKSK